MLSEKRFSLKEKIILGAFILLTFFVTDLLKRKADKPRLQVSMEDRATNYSGTFLKFTSLGNQRMISSLLWTHTLLFSDIEHYKEDDLNSWMYLRFNTITDLDPKMYEAYYYGGQYLSIIKDDIFGAEVIYLKGINQFPNDLWLNYLAGFNYLFEIGDKQKGLERFLSIKDHPDLMQTIPILPSIMAKLLRDSNDLESIFIMLRSAWEKASDQYMKNRYWDSMYAIRAEIDLNCLNQAQSNCQMSDLDGNSYLNEGGIYRAQKDWTKFQTKKRERKKRSP